MSAYLKPEDLAERFGISRRTVMRKVGDKKWPCLRVSKKCIRFTDEHVAQIEALTETTSFSNVINLHGIKTRRTAQ